MTSSKHFDFVIIGGGIVGLTLARELKLQKLGSVVVLEKENELGQHASGNNSGVLHAGVYYPADSMKAKFCREGRKLLSAYVEENKIPINKSGKVIVAGSSAELDQLAEIEKRALANQVRVERVNTEDLKKIEPLAESVQWALYSPDTAVVNPMLVLQSLRRELERLGVEFLMGTEALSISPKLKKVNHEIGYGHLFNCAGSGALKVGSAFGLGGELALIPFVGLYREVLGDLAAQVRGNIYPVPDLNLPFLGVHLTRTPDGRTFAGPTAMPLVSFRGLSMLAQMWLKNSNGIRRHSWVEVKRIFKRNFAKEIQRLAPSIKEDVLSGYCRAGVRPQLIDRRSRKMVLDFSVACEQHSTHVFNAVSPAFTASMSFAKSLVEI